MKRTQDMQYGQPGGGSSLVRPARHAAPVAELDSTDNGAVTR